MPTTAKWLRSSLLGLVIAAALAGMVALAYELALARVPQHRAALERLVRAHTGLDVRFNELSVRWGWYGPEAVFKRVELGEPGGSSVLLRAPQLVVGFDAWRTMRSGQLEPGRVTLTAPDIDLERLAPASPRRVPGHTSAAPSAAQLLQRWRGGLIEIQGGTLRMRSAQGNANPVVLHIRRASLKRSDDQWNAFGLVFLPERLGRTARVALQLQGNLEVPHSVSGALRFEGKRLLFGGWHELLAPSWSPARAIPLTGGGDSALRVRFDHGRIEKADGVIRADSLTLDAPPWFANATEAEAADRALQLPYLAGNWRIVRRGEGWQVRVEELALARDAKDESLPTLSLEITGSGEKVHGALARAPLDSLLAVARWLSPAPVLQFSLAGTAHDIEFDWNGARPSGEKLRTHLRVADAALTMPAERFTVEGLAAQLSGSESSIDIRLDTPRARLGIADTAEALDPVRLQSKLRLTRTASSWELSTQELSMAHAAAELVIAGTLKSSVPQQAPTLELRGSISRADVALVQKSLGATLRNTLGPVASRLSAGHIEDGSFEVRETLDASSGARPQRFIGSLLLRDASAAGDEWWPEMQGLDARLQWNGARLQAVIESAHASPFEVNNLDAEWSTEEDSAARITGQLRGRLEAVLPWLAARENLTLFAPSLQQLAAQGDAAFDIEVEIPPARHEVPRHAPAAGQPRQPVTHVVASLENASLRLAAPFPAVESVRGALAFDSGRLRKSTVTARWLGGPLTLRVGERRDRKGATIAVQAQGMLDAKALMALTAAGSTRALKGQSAWNGELAYVPASGGGTPHWQAHAEANLVGVASDWPQPLNKLEDESLPLRIEASGTDETSTMRASLADRLRTTFAFDRGGAGWKIERGMIRLGPGSINVPERALISIQGRLGQLDLGAYVGTWQRLQQDQNSPALELSLTADQLEIAGHSYDDVLLQATSSDGASELQLESPLLAGTIRWPANARGVEARFARLSVPERSQPGELAEAFAALGESGTASVDEFVWHGHALGRLSATLGLRNGAASVHDVRLVGDHHDARGSIECDAALTRCRAQFELESADAAATLADFGFRSDLSASHADLSGELQWSPDSHRALLESAVGHVSMRIADGVAHTDTDSSDRPFALLTVPALLAGMKQPSINGTSPTTPAELRFTSLEADFELRDGQAHTSDLHFDGDAEILIRGRTGLTSRDYDHTAWVLRGEDRIPAAVRRLGGTPRVAAAWLGLRELLRGDAAGRNGIVLHLRGSWSDPIVTLE